MQLYTYAQSTTSCNFRSLQHKPWPSLAPPAHVRKTPTKLGQPQPPAPAAKVASAAARATERSPKRPLDPRPQTLHRTHPRPSWRISKYQSSRSQSGRRGLGSTGGDRRRSSAPRAASISQARRTGASLRNTSSSISVLRPTTSATTCKSKLNAVSVSNNVKNDWSYRWQFKTLISYFPVNFQRIINIILNHLYWLAYFTYIWNKLALAFERFVVVFFVGLYFFQFRFCYKSAINVMFWFSMFLNELRYIKRAFFSSLDWVYWEKKSVAWLVYWGINCLRLDRIKCVSPL